ncbi:MAG: beta-eliminating lyase-related protein [Pseudomonadota bacterium]
MNFASDNVSPLCPEILEALSAEASGNAPAYGGDDPTQKLDRVFSDLFDTDVAVLPVATGTAANCISLSALTSPYGGIICHHDAHINDAELTGPAFFTGGAQLLTMDGPAAKLEPDALTAYLAAMPARGVHNVAAECVAITQATELGAVYSPDEVAAIGDVCKSRNLRLFMDGARFANAMAWLNCPPADVTWKAGVDALGFGATKNGAMAVDAIVLFDTSLRFRIELARKRSGHLHSKHRYLAAQLLAYIKNDVWLNNARNANDAAKTLNDMLVALGARPVHASCSNELFLHIPDDLAKRLRDNGVSFHAWTALGADVYRFVTAWNSSLDDIRALGQRLAG